VQHRGKPRYELGRKVQERSTYRGAFTRFGSKPGNLTTVLLTQIKDSDGKVVTDHLWLNYTLGFRRLGRLQSGDQVIFDARVTTYRKWRGIDYRLSYPTKLRLVRG